MFEFGQRVFARRFDGLGRPQCVRVWGKPPGGGYLGQIEHGTPCIVEAVTQEDYPHYAERGPFAEVVVETADVSLRGWVWLPELVPFTIPRVDGRSKREDLKKVARLRIYEWQNSRISGKPEQVSLISTALGESYSLTSAIFEGLTAAEREAVSRWESYCEALYEAIPAYLQELVK